MNIQKNRTLEGANGRPILFDVFWQPSEKPLPILLFAHGFKGFKDWGHWDKIAQTFAQAGFLFIKFNFSHNGTTVHHPTEFADLEAFGQNNYTKELTDLDAILDWLNSRSAEILGDTPVDLTNLTLIGHSRGGGVAVLKAGQDARIRRLITWASVPALDWSWRSEQVEIWQKAGVFKILNARTGQEMPLYYQFYEDFEAHKEAYNVLKAAAMLQKPFLIVHGTADPSVSVEAAHQLKAASQNAQLLLIENCDHVFGGHHPFSGESLPPESQILVDGCLAFLRTT